MIIYYHFFFYKPNFVSQSDDNNVILLYDPYSPASVIPEKTLVKDDGYSAGWVDMSQSRNSCLTLHSEALLLKK